MFAELITLAFLKHKQIILFTKHEVFCAKNSIVETKCIFFKILRKFVKEVADNALFLKNLARSYKIANFGRFLQELLFVEFLRELHRLQEPFNFMIIYISCKLRLCSICMKHLL